MKPLPAPISILLPLLLFSAVAASVSANLSPAPVFRPSQAGLSFCCLSSVDGSPLLPANTHTQSQLNVIIELEPGRRIKRQQLSSNASVTFINCEFRDR